MEREHDVTELQKRLTTVQAELRKLGERDLEQVLVPIWRRPGWTTPVEFFLVGELMATVELQIPALDRSVETLVRGSDLVGS